MAGSAPPGERRHSGEGSGQRCEDDRTDPPPDAIHARSGFLQRFQDGPQLASVAEAITRLFREEATDDASEGFRRAFAQWRWWILKNGRRQLEPGPTREWELSGQKLVQEHAEGPEIGPLVGRLPAKQFGSHVGRRACGAA